MDLDFHIDTHFVFQKSHSFRFNESKLVLIFFCSKPSLPLAMMLFDELFLKQFVSSKFLILTFF